MADINKLAVLINLAGGDIGGLASEMQIDSSILETALQFGESGLTRNERLELGEKLARYERLELDEFAQAEIEDYATAVNELESLIDDFKNGDSMRQAIAADNLKLEDLETAFLLFGNGYTTLNIQNKLIEFFNSDSLYNKDLFLRMFELDGYHLSDIKNSHFWAWYREIFYND